MAPLPLTTGVHVLLGGTAGMLAARCLGVVPAMVVALVASSWTLVLWHHPFALPVFVAEAATVAWLHRRWRLDILVADILFWGLAAVPAVPVLYAHALGLNAVAVELVTLKQAANGLINVVLANLIGLFACRRWRLPQARVSSLTMLFFNLLAGFALLPGLLVIGIQAGQTRETVLDAAVEQLEANRQRVRQRFAYVAEDLRRGLQVDLERVLRTADAHGAPAPGQVMARLVRERPEEVLVLLAPGGGETLSPAAREQRAAAAALRQWPSSRPLVDAGLGADGEIFVAVSSTLAATATWELRAALPLDASLLLLEGFRPGAGGMLEALMDGSGDCRIGASGPGCFALAKALSDPGYEAQELRPNLIRLTPVHAGVPAMTRSGRALYLMRGPLLPDSPWQLVVGMSAAADIDRLREHALRSLKTLLLVLLCALPVGYVASRWLAGQLARLSRTLDALAPALSDGRNPGSSVDWPRVEISEIDALTAHVQAMAEALFRAREEGLARAEELRVLADRLQVANRGAGIGVWEWHLGSGELIFDEQMYEVLGLDRQVTPCYEVWLSRLVPEDRAATEAELRRCLDAEDTFRAEFRVQHPRQGLRFVLGYAVIFRDDAGLATRLVGLNWDITEQRMLQAGLIQSSKLATLGEMATAVAHELNQPLNVIGMAAGNLRRRLVSHAAEPAYLMEKVEVIRAQVRRAAAIIDHMRIFGRKAVGSPAPIDVCAAAKAAVELMSEQLRQARIALHVSCAGDVPPVLGHQVQVEQVVLNLLTNARDALLDCATVEACIHVSVRTTGDAVELRVGDNAGGIAPEHLDRVFEPFFTTKAAGKGTGLGLSVSYGIITDMHGTISVENTAGGAAFTVRLPVALPGGGG